MSYFSLRYSDEYNGEVLLVFCFAKVMRIKERSYVSLCKSGEDRGEVSSVLVRYIDENKNERSSVSLRYRDEDNG